MAQIGWNALRGKETRKLETFLVDARRKAGIALKNRVRGVFGKKKVAPVAG